MALAHHWLDEVIPETATADSLGAAILASPKFKQIVKVAIDEATLYTDQTTGRHPIGTSPTQIIRVAIVNGFKSADADTEASENNS